MTTFYWCLIKTYTDREPDVGNPVGPPDTDEQFHGTAQEYARYRLRHMVGFWEHEPDPKPVRLTVKVWASKDGSLSANAPHDAAESWEAGMPPPA